MYLRLEHIPPAVAVAPWNTEVAGQVFLRPVSPNTKGVDEMTDLKLFPGVAIVYASSLRYQNVPPEAITVDMFDAKPLHSDVVEKRSGVPEMGLKEGPSARPFETRSYVDGKLPRALSDKMATLHVVGTSMGCTRTSHVIVPGVGIAFGTGVAWVNLTEEDCRDAQQEAEEREKGLAASEASHGS